MKRLGVFVLPQGLDASLSKPYRLLVPVLHLERKVNVRVKCPQPGLEPRLLYLESSTLVIRPLNLHKREMYLDSFSHGLCCAFNSFRGWKCARCDLKDNLWLNLTDGTILCGRRYFDGWCNYNNIYTVSIKVIF